MAVGLIFVLMGTSVFPLTATVIGKPSVPQLTGNWLYVGGSGPENFTTIQNAIDNASNGDTVFVFNGTYDGYVILNKAINLIGQDKNTTIIIGYFAYTISFVTDWVNMSGFTIMNNARRGEGVRIDSSHNTFTNNIIDIPNDRIRLFGHSNTFSANTVKNTYLYISGDDNIVSGNTFTNIYYSPLSNDLYGIYLMDCWNNIISNNSFFKAGIFISLENVCNNIVTQNMVNGKPLIYFYNQSNGVIDDKTGQILLVNCTNITIQNQEIVNTTVGIQIVGSTSCIISSNTITSNHYGICLNGWNNTIENNNITNNYYGIDLSGDHNIIAGNSISNNRDAIYLDYSTDYNTIIDNTIANNHNSLLLDYGSDFNDIINNTITNSTDEILISGDNNTIAGNTITDTNDAGIWIMYSDYIDIIDNRITNSKSCGIISYRSNHNTIINNSIINTYGDGIDFNGDNATIFHNTIINTSFNGITLEGGNAIISENTIMNTSYDGILLFGNQNTISANIVCYNKNGIYVQKHGFNTFKNNIISWNNLSGIYLNSSNNNSISGNSISKNRQGIYVVLSTNNTIYRNNLWGNKRHALFENCTNSWNQNYWGRPRVLPKPIFGIKMIQNEWVVPLIDIDWHPVFRPYSK
jgi:parallel beta-helix repeat protein